MNTYNVHLLWPDGLKEKIQIHVDGTVKSLTDIPPSRYQRIHTAVLEAGAKIHKIVGPLGLRKSTPKQKLAQSYGFIMGSLKGAQAKFNIAHGMLPNGLDAQKVNRAEGLVTMQFAKLERDISDFFKLAGLKVK